jgi:DNA polymerase
MPDRKILQQIHDYLETRRELEGGLFLDAITVEALKGLSEQFETLEEFRDRISGCQKCLLGKTRTNFVFGDGDAHSKIVFIGEAPGKDEDLQGIPFVGRAGKLLDEILFKTGFNRKEVYICNILKCRPPENRDPLPEEVAQCEPYLWRQLEIIQPKLIVALGRISAQTLLKTDLALNKLKMTSHNYRGIPFYITYHTAAILRNMNLLPEVERDFKSYYEKYKALEER